MNAALDTRARVVLRPASLEAAALLLEWRNDEETRRQSFSTEPIGWEQHRAFLSRRIDRIQIAYSADGFPVGQVRIDEGWVSYSVSKVWRGRGFGAAIIAAVMGRSPLFADVKATNQPSLAIFRKLGWTECVVDGVHRFTYTPHAR
jgi:RimJ/RimL family protein N-acetyltransferase